MPHHYKDAISYMNEPMSSGRRTRREGCHVFLTNGFLFHTATDQGPWITPTSSQRICSSTTMPRSCFPDEQLMLIAEDVCGLEVAWFPLQDLELEPFLLHTEVQMTHMACVWPRDTK